MFRVGLLGAALLGTSLGTALGGTALAPLPPTGSLYHADIERTGNYVVPGLTWTTASTMHLSTNFNGRVPGNIQGEPLYWLPPGASHGMVIVGTDQNVIAALDAATGNVVWSRSLGTPFTAAICGHLPLAGIAGTSLIDARNGIIYLDSSQVDAGNKPHHYVYALSTRDGSVLPGWPLDVQSLLLSQGQSFDASLEGQRGALALLNGQLYIPFGGNRGDCGAYHGVVVGIAVNPGGTPRFVGAWMSRAQKAGVWAMGGVVDDGQSLFFATGNAKEGSVWQDGEAVFRLNPNMQHATSTADYFYPSYFATLDTGDLDLGGAAPVLIDVNGPSKRAHFLLQLGKDGKAYVLGRSNLGGVDGALLVQQVASAEIRNGPSVYETSDVVYVTFGSPGSNCPSGPVQPGIATLAVRSTPTPTITTAWCAPLQTKASPIVTTSGPQQDPIVWIISAPNGDGLLHGYRADTGAVVFNGGTSRIRLLGTQIFSTILAAEQRLFVGGGGQLYAFDFTP